MEKEIFMPKSKRTMRMMVGVALIVGLLLGSMLTGYLVAADNVYTQLTIFTHILRLVERNYVEQVDTGDLMDGAITGLLKQLDPHSSFLSRDSFDNMSEKFSGNFYGIGIYFDIKDGVLTVISAIEDTPAHKVGLRSGDQIVGIDGVSIVGINQSEVRNKLRGPKGTEVMVTVRRQGLDEPLDLTIVRDKIPIRSVSSAFMLDPETGYIHLSHFSQTTGDEIEQALTMLEEQGMQRLLFDLRGNAGGYLEQAVEVADKFIEGGNIILSTRGRIPNSNREYRATDAATHTVYPVIVLINKGSASASEIVAGAIQDWDRGLIIGTTSFGKGLVQSVYNLSDGSALKLTTAQYYTPSGRLIQRDYKSRSHEDYLAAAGESDATLVAADGHAVTNRSVYTTAAGRIVYGGGGINPDIRIEAEEYTSKLMAMLLSKRLFLEFASHYMGTRRDQFAAMELTSYVNEYVVSGELVQQFVDWSGEKEVVFADDEWQRDGELIALYIKKELAINLWGGTAGRQVLAQDDSQLQEAVLRFPDAEQLLAGQATTN